jgi:DNA topoisomerase-6 subunit B
VIRYANRVPLLYQQSACAIFKAVLATTWRNYGISQSRGALPAGPMVIFVHIASVWVPFTSESKEAIAEYDEIHKEITLALRECGRRLGLFLRRRERAASEFRRRNIFELYIEEVVEACNRLKGGKLPTEKLKAQLQKIASSRTGGIKTDETLGKTGSGPEGLPHSIIVTADGIEGDVPPTLDPSRIGAPVADVSDEIHIEEKQPASILGRKQIAKGMTGKGSFSRQKAGAVRTGSKAHLTRKKK